MSRNSTYSLSSISLFFSLATFFLFFLDRLLFSRSFLFASILRDIHAQDRNGRSYCYLPAPTDPTKLKRPALRAQGYSLCLPCRPSPLCFLPLSLVMSLSLSRLPRYAVIHSTPRYSHSTPNLRAPYYTRIVIQRVMQLGGFCTNNNAHRTNRRRLQLLPPGQGTAWEIICFSTLSVLELVEFDVPFHSIFILHIRFNFPGWSSFFPLHSFVGFAFFLIPFLPDYHSLLATHRWSVCLAGLLFYPPNPDRPWA